jgi:uncharacterized membrane protein HdeD (DUF308 family)
MGKVLGTATGVVLAAIAVVLIVSGVAEVVVAGDDDEFADWFMALVAAATTLTGAITGRMALALFRRT